MECYYRVFGRVQGVGYRNSVVKFILRSGLALKGYVRNMPDGSVEILAQGQATELKLLEEFCQGLVRVEGHEGRGERAGDGA